MASKGDYILSKGFNQNIFHWNDKDTYVNTINKQGKGFFPGNEILNPKEPDEPPVPPAPTWDPYLTFSSAELFSVSTIKGSKSWDGTLEYSTDTENWTEWDGTKVDSSENGELYFRGSNNTVISIIDLDEWTTNRWILTGNNISCTGNIENLLDYQTVESGEHPQMGIGCYGGMFFNCISLTAAPQLPATILVNNCYKFMFANCTSLTTAPELPATTLAEGCYQDMFNSCTSLITAPELPATTLASLCYSEIFTGCTSLTTVPELPATILVDNCYNGMFKGCTSLTTAPQLPATTLARYCYTEMFQGCTSLTTAPQLSATTLADYCYSGMFRSCKSLTITPELLATTLANSCYSGMFQGCISLVATPELPATILIDKCYNSMFYGCSSLKLSTTQTADYTTPYRIPKEGTGTNATNALVNMFKNTGGTFTGTPTINTTYYLHKDNHIV